VNNEMTPIVLIDELEDKVIRANARLNLATGAIDQVSYLKYDVVENGPPYKRKDYEFSSAKLAANGKEIEFTVKVDKALGKYSVSAAELTEVKLKAAIKT
jgi:hypothetical protein